MDIDLTRTFLQIVRTGSLVAAASQLNVTQTAVTARIKTLETQLNCRLFVRSKAGATLTADGEKFLEYANRIMQSWEAARRELPALQHRQIYRLGADTSLSNPLMLLWSNALRQRHPSCPVRVELGDRVSVQHKVRSGLLDAALVFEPEYVAGMQIEQVVEEKLIHVRTVDRPGEYVYVDWGAEFRRQHDLALPEYVGAPMYFDFGPIALQYVLLYGGHGYFRARVMSTYLEQRVLERVPDAPEFSYPVFAVYPRASTRPGVRESLDALRQLATNDADWSQRWGSHLPASRPPSA
ncbi:LysR family transcriptional regulator [Paraburkholderia jirisanensis]